jgi:hypothetical protein
LTYFNGTVEEETAPDKINLKVNIDFVNPEGVSENFIYTLKLINTPNIIGSPPEAQADIVSLPSILPRTVFSIDGIDFTLKLTFGNVTPDTGGFSKTNKFYVLEGQSATAELWGVFTTCVSPVNLTVVPNVLDMPLSNAQEVIANAGLVVGRVSIANSDIVPVGLIMDQAPESGTKVTYGSAVHVIISYTDSFDDVKGWRRRGYDIGGTSNYPFASLPTSGKLNLLWNVSDMNNAAVLTADLNDDNVLDIVTSDESSLNAFDGYGNLLWSIQGSGNLSYIGDIDGDIHPEVCVTYLDENFHLMADIYNADGSYDKTLDRGSSGDDSFMTILTHFIDYLIAGYGAGYSLSPRGVGILRYSSGKEDAYFASGGGGIWGTFGIGDSDNDGLFEIALPWGTPHNGASENGTTDDDLFGVVIEADISTSPAELRSQFIKNVSNWNTTTNPNGYLSAMMPDLDEDGVSEILFLEGHDSVYYPGSHYVYEVSSAGQLNLTWQGALNGKFSLGTIVNDLTNDGIKEIVISDRDNENISLIDGSTFSTLKESTGIGKVLGATDFNGDGQDEIIVHQSSSGNVIILDAVTLSEISHWNIGDFNPFMFDQLNRFAISDVTGDGKLELILGSSNGLYVLNSKDIPKPKESYKLLLPWPGVNPGGLGWVGMIPFSEGFPGGLPSPLSSGYPPGLSIPSFPGTYPGFIYPGGMPSAWTSFLPRYPATFPVPGIFTPIGKGGPSNYWIGFPYGGFYQTGWFYSYR